MGVNWHREIKLLNVSLGGHKLCLDGVLFKSAGGGGNCGTGTATTATAVGRFLDFDHFNCGGSKLQPLLIVLFFFLHFFAIGLNFI